MKTTAELATRSGTVLVVRPADAGDEAALGAFFDAVSDEDRRFRFFTAADHIGPDQLAPLVHADHFRSESFLAFDKASGELVGSALLACDGPLETAEVAVSIRKDCKGKGVGWALLGFLAEQARARGAHRVISIEARANHAAIDLEREHGFVPAPFDGDDSLVILTKTFR